MTAVMTAVADNPLRGPRLMLAVLAVIALAVIGRSTARGAEPAPRDSDLQLRAKAALALAEAEASARKQAVAAAGKPATAPAPRLAKLPYPAAYRQATVDQLPLLVYVSCDGPRVEGAIVSKTDSFGEVTAPSVVVGFPSGDRVLIDSVTPEKDATPAAVRKAVRAAAAKIEDPPQPMPARKQAPVPLDYQIRSGVPDRVPAYLPTAGGVAAKTACICGDSCKCAAGKCPSGCPVAAKPTPAAEPEVIVTATGRKIRKVGSGYVYADEDKAVKEVRPAVAVPFPLTPPTTTTAGTPTAPTAAGRAPWSGSTLTAPTRTGAFLVVPSGPTGNCAPGQA